MNLEQISPLSHCHSSSYPFSEESSVVATAVTHFIDGDNEPQESTKSKADPSSLALHPKQEYSALWSIIARKGRQETERMCGGRGGS